MSYFSKLHNTNINPDNPLGWASILDRIDASGTNLPLLATSVAYIVTTSTFACITNYCTAAAFTWHIQPRPPTPQHRADDRLNSNHLGSVYIQQ